MESNRERGGNRPPDLASSQARQIKGETQHHPAQKGEASERERVQVNPPPGGDDRPRNPAPGPASATPSPRDKSA